MKKLVSLHTLTLDLHLNSDISMSTKCSSNSDKTLATSSSMLTGTAGTLPVPVAVDRNLFKASFSSLSLSVSL